jgi:hypothetical protein
VPLGEFDERVPTLLQVFGAPVDVDAPPTPFALGPELDGADFDLRGRGLGETDSEVCPTCGIAPFSEASDKSGTPMSAVNAAASKASRFQLSR